MVSHIKFPTWTNYSAVQRKVLAIPSNGVADPSPGMSPFALLNHRWLGHFDFNPGHRWVWGYMTNHPENFQKHPWEKHEESIILDFMGSSKSQNTKQPCANRCARIPKELHGRYSHHALEMLFLRSAPMRFK